MHNYAVAGVAVASLTIGAASGYFFAKKKLIREYDVILEEQIARTREHYKKTYKTDEYATPEAAAEALGVEVSPNLEPAIEAVKQYATMDTGDAFAEMAISDAVIVEKNIFDDDEQLAIDKDARDTSKPYAVTIDEYMDVPDGYEQLELTYYAGDNQLADDKEEPIRDVELTVGADNLKMFGSSDPDQPHVLLVRNERLKTDFEITYSDGKFAHEVLGFELKHSDEPRRKRPRWDDD